MSSEGRPFAHRPVMADEVVEAFAPVPPGLVVDATVGAGGHARLILDAHPHLGVVGIDQDGDALAAAAGELAPFGHRVRLVRARFDHLAEVLNEEGLGEVRSRDEAPGASGVLFDLGVSSPQLDRPERGFSYREDGPLDMRMDTRGGLTAADVVNGYPQSELARILARNADERFASRIAAAIVAARPISGTAELADVVRGAIPAPARRRGGHPAKRTFQAVRMEVNEELPSLERALAVAIDALAPKGRCVVISYHSGEDRLVKDVFSQAATGGCTCPPGLPCACGAVPTVRLVRAAKRPTAGEVEANPRASSARMRVVERLGPRR